MGTDEFLRNVLLSSIHAGYSSIATFCYQRLIRLLSIWPDTLVKKNRRFSSLFIYQNVFLTPFFFFFHFSKFIHTQKRSILSGLILFKSIYLIAYNMSLPLTEKQQHTEKCLSFLANVFRAILVWWLLPDLYTGHYEFSYRRYYVISPVRKH